MGSRAAVVSVTGGGGVGPAKCFRSGPQRVLASFNRYVIEFKLYESQMIYYGE